MALLQTAGRVGIAFNLHEVEAKLASAIEASKKMEALVVGVRHGLKPIQADAARLARKPGSPGYNYPSFGSRRRQRPKLYQQIIVQVRPYYESKRVLGLVGPRYDPHGGGANHGHLVEHGHRIANRGTLARSGRLAGKRPPRSRLGDAFTGRGSVLGRTRAFPFLKPASDANHSQAQAAFVKATTRYIDSVLKQVGNG